MYTFYFGNLSGNWYKNKCVSSQKYQVTSIHVLGDLLFCKLSSGGCNVVLGTLKWQSQVLFVVVLLRESVYRLLPQTTTENISKNFEQYTIDPASRYPNLNSSCVRPHQVSSVLHVVSSVMFISEER